jgi:predicted lipoprotein with Yx(FWY)xxD motif
MIGAAAAALTVSGALADDYVGGAIQSMASDKGEILTDAKGMTLYIFDKDEAGMSNCYDKCAVNWPPAMAADGAMADGAFSLVERKDGAKQWAHDGMPLYYWIEDLQAGDTNGDGVGGVWHVVVDDDAM